ncbi:hypothetical protein FOMPIDRAFT_1054148 [Fomitopsis schrenkii]|uniref:Uncharacterized protein n=1 Tax=Fomitopsis schrenkii TaxID=2126942 RepID=S8DQ20_FOMSC|nr:hypothetical protein FOMPIDRAFT_1054148 [Fomitopsis schrenkii]
MKAARGSGAVAAVLYALLHLPRDVPLHVVSEKDTLTAPLFKRRQGWEDIGWEGVQGALYVQALINQLRQRCAPTSFGSGTGAHSTPLAQARCQLEDAEHSLDRPTIVAPEKNMTFELSGAKLSSLSQAQAYRCIRAEKTRVARPATERQMLRILANTSAAGQKCATAEDVWVGIRHKDIL